MGLSKPKAATAPIPEKAEFETQIDNVAGTKVERVKQPDGTYAIIRSSLPMSAEDQAYMDALTQMQTQSLQRLDQFTNNFNLDELPELKQAVEDYKTSNMLIIDNAARDNAISTERSLARFGQADSTAATELRGVQDANVLGQKAQLGRELSGIVQQGRADAINQQGSLYNLATGAINGQQATQLGSLTTSLGSGYQGQGINQGYNNSVAATIAANNQAKANAAQAGLSSFSSLAQLAGKAGLAYATGGTSLLADSFLGSNTSGAYNRGFGMWGR